LSRVVAEKSQLCFINNPTLTSSNAWPGTQITSVQLFATRLMEFEPGAVASHFHYSCCYRPDSWPEFCLATDTVACLTGILFRRLDAALQKMSM
jgi:hypothetical protein